MTPPTTHVSDGRYMVSVQWLRGIAAMLVVLRHTCAWSSDELTSPESFPIGPFGVDLFFIISGFVMSVTGPGQNAGRFFFKRIARIVPLYWFVSFAKLGLLLCVDRGSWAKISIFHFASSLFFIPCFNNEGEIAPFVFAGWTLNFEMFFYLICTFTLCISQRLAVVGSLFLITCVSIGIALNQIGASDFAARVLLGDIILEFALGMLAGELWKREFRLGIFYTLALLVVPACLGLLLAPYCFPYTPFRSLTWGLPAFAIFLAAIQCEPWSFLHKNRLGRMLGDASYSIYLTHPIVIPVVGSLLRKAGLGFYWIEVPTITIASVVVGWIVYSQVEKRLNRFAQNLLPGRSNSRRP